MKILHTADWHIGSFKGPEENGKNLRLEDTKKCLDFLVAETGKERPDVVLISGDIFHSSSTYEKRGVPELDIAINYIEQLSAVCPVAVMRGTPNHDGEERFAHMENIFKGNMNVEIIMNPKLLSFNGLEVAAIPGFDRGKYRSKFPGFSKEEENAVFTEELSNIALGLRAQCTTGVPCVLMSHYTVPGANMESGQVAFYNQSEPILLQETLNTAKFDLVALGHIHKPQIIMGCKNTYYSGAINSFNFNDEGQGRGFWIHELGEGENRSNFVYTPNRKFQTINLDNDDIELINTGSMDMVSSLWQFTVEEKMVRVLYECTLENKKAFNSAILEKRLYEDGAFYVSDIYMANSVETISANALSKQTDPEVNLQEYLQEKGFFEDAIKEVIELGRPIIDRVMAANTMGNTSGLLMPISISVKNYRNYVEEAFDFKDITFCTINGQNGAGKSSLFMDAILDCLYEEPREGELTGWINNSPSAKAGMIEFVFSIGEKIFRVTRTRVKSGKATLNISEKIDGEWESRSLEKIRDTQEEIVKIIGMDSLTFRSCALIMQDQYGLFLQAAKEDRMATLGNLLGLHIYNDMEKEAKQLGMEVGRNMSAGKTKIEVQDKRLQEIGEVESELEYYKSTLPTFHEKLQVHQKALDDNNALLLNTEESYQRYEKAKKDMIDLDIKREGYQANMATLQATIDDCQKVVSTEEVIEKKVEIYNQLDEEEISLTTSVKLYESKSAELIMVNKELNNTVEEKAEYESRLVDLNGEMELLTQDCDIEQLKKDSERYNELNEEIAKMRDLKEGEEKVLQEVSEIEFDLKQAESYWEHIKEKRVVEIDGLRREEGLLNNSNCIDPQNADCNFLQSARKARLQADNLEVELQSYEKEQLEAIDKIRDCLLNKQKEVGLSGYEKEEFLELQREFSNSEENASKYRAEQENRGKLEGVRANITNMQDNISKVDKRLLEVKIRAEKIEREQLIHQESFERMKEVKRLKQEAMPYLEKAKVIPVAKERLKNAEDRLYDVKRLSAEAKESFLDKERESKEELAKATDLAMLREKKQDLNQQVDKIKEQISNIQVSFGKVKQKQEDAERIKQEIRIIQEEVKKYAKKVSIYDILKIAFSQDGVPHQIVRFIIPQLTTTANSILGQMTNGKVGIEFVTEKTLKSNNKKEVVALDILIEEYGKGSLPYLSKSGGEKVKSSLAAVLALSEIKATSIGVQSGMLFIDEPPFLDGDGVQAYVDALDAIQKRYTNVKIMAITHDPTMKARFPQSLEVIKTDEGSKVLMD